MIFDADKGRLYHTIMSSQRLRFEEYKDPTAAQFKDHLFSAFRLKAVDSRIAMTNTQTRILDLLWNLADNLSNGRYTSTNGAATMLLLGAKGIGKTCTCQAFIDICPTIVNISCIWVDCYGFVEDNHLLCVADLKTCIALRLFGHTFQRAWKLLQGPIGDLDTLLASHQKRAIIIVDELDEVYRFKPTKDSNTALNMLGMLQLLGNSREGRAAVVLCGSSAQLPSLISRNESRALEDEFPLLLHGTPNLNETKYSSQRVWAPMSTDVETAKNILEAKNIYLDAKDLRHLIFTIGTNPRELSKFALNGSYEAGDKRHSEMSTNLRNHPHARNLLNAILDALFKANSKLLTPMVDSLALASSNADWPTTFAPLSYKQVEKQWAALLADKKVKRTEKGSLQATLFYLCDRGYIVYEAGERRTYPDAVLTVITRHLEKQDPLRLTRYRKEVFDRLAALIPKTAAVGAKAALVA
jgi:hypothetical protein